MESNDSQEAGNGLAKKVGIIAGVVALVVILGGGMIAMSMGLGVPLVSGDAEKRGEALGFGAVMMSFWIGLMAWGIARLAVRARARRAKA